MEGEKIRQERLKKGKERDIIKMSFPMNRVEDTTTSYRFSKIYTSKFTYFPNEDECSHHAYMKQVFALRELDLAEKRLAAKRLEAKKITKELDQRWSELHEGQRSLKENFSKFNEFMKENQEKRERALRKIQEEIALQDERKDMVLKLDNRMEYYHKIQTMMVRKIKEYRLYEDYLMQVVRVSTDFKNVPAVLNRFQALVEAKLSSARKHEREIVALETARARTSKLMEEKITILLGLRSKFGGLNYRYEAARVKVLSWESTLQEVRMNILREYIQGRSVLGAGKQLHKMMCRRKNMRPHHLNFEQRVSFIQHTLTQLHWLRYMKLARLKDGHDEPYDTKRQTERKVAVPQSTEEEKQTDKEMGKSRLSIFAYLLYDRKASKRKLQEHNHKSVRSKRSTVAPAAGATLRRM